MLTERKRENPKNWVHKDIQPPRLTCQTKFYEPQQTNLECHAEHTKKQLDALGWSKQRKVLAFTLGVVCITKWQSKVVNTRKMWNFSKKRLWFREGEKGKWPEKLNSLAAHNALSLRNVLSIRKMNNENMLLFLPKWQKIKPINK